MPTLITPKRKEHPGLTTTDNVIFLERRGTTTSLEWHDSPFSVHIFSITPRPGLSNLPTHRLLEITRTVGTEGRTIVYEAVRDHGHAGILITASLAKYDVTASVSPYVIGYGYPFAQTHDYERTDVYISPVRYDRTMKSACFAFTGEAVLTFIGEDLDSTFGPAANLAPPILHEARARSFAPWLHANDRARGPEYCRRRITWLIGQHLLRDAPVPQPSAVLRHDLETDVDLSRPNP